jgi:hypothetical protein
VLIDNMAVIDKEHFWPNKFKPIISWIFVFKEATGRCSEPNTHCTRGRWLI